MGVVGGGGGGSGFHRVQELMVRIRVIVEECAQRRQESLIKIGLKKLRTYNGGDGVITRPGARGVRR